MLEVKNRRRRWWIWIVALVLAAGVAYISRETWLREIGEFLVEPEQPQKADVAIVLAGDGYGHRLMRAVELVHKGYAKHVLVDGPLAAYGVDESALAIQWAVRKGVPRQMLEPLPMRARSTVAEAQIIDAELTKRHVQTALVVTSNFHTRRARAVFRRFGSSSIRYIVVDAPDEDFGPADWWRSREAKKIVLLEYAKLLNWWLE